MKMCSIPPTKKHCERDLCIEISLNIRNIDKKQTGDFDIDIVNHCDRIAHLHNSI